MLSMFAPHSINQSPQSLLPEKNGPSSRSRFLRSSVRSPPLRMLWPSNGPPQQSPTRAPSIEPRNLASFSAGSVRRMLAATAAGSSSGGGGGVAAESRARDRVITARKFRAQIARDNFKAVGERMVCRLCVSRRRSYHNILTHFSFYGYMRICMRCFDWLFTYDGHVLDDHNYAQL